MSYRTDKFSVGDKVIWAEGMKPSWHSEMGDGPFEIIEIVDQPYISPEEWDDGQSNWDGMGHTQHVTLKKNPEWDDPDLDDYVFSGAFFLKVQS